MNEMPETELVEVEALPDPPSPFAFGLKALLVLTAIVAVQFALMSYLGPLVGLLAGIALCILGMGVLLVASISLGLRPGSGLLDQLDRIAIRLVVGIVILFFGSIIAGGGQLAFMALEDARFQWKMQNDLGFTYLPRTVFDPDTGDVTNVLEVLTISTGGPLDQAGVVKGDLIVLEGMAIDFLKKLDEQRGQAVDIGVANYAASSANSDIDEATLRTATVHVPP